MKCPDIGQSTKQRVFFLVGNLIFKTDLIIFTYFCARSCAIIIVKFENFYNKSKMFLGKSWKLYTFSMIQNYNFLGCFILIFCAKSYIFIREKTDFNSLFFSIFINNFPKIIKVGLKISDSKITYIIIIQSLKYRKLFVRYTF